MRKFHFHQILFLTLLLIMGCEEKNDDDQNTNKVVMKDLAFAPKTITVKPGTTVTWTNQDNVNHTVTRTGDFDSGIIPAGGTFTYTFDNEGTYDYECTVHPQMTGTVVVKK